MYYPSRIIGMYSCIVVHSCYQLTCYEAFQSRSQKKMRRKHNQKTPDDEAEWLDGKLRTKASFTTFYYMRIHEIKLVMLTDFLKTISTIAQAGLCIRVLSLWCYTRPPKKSSESECIRMFRDLRKRMQRLMQNFNRQSCCKPARTITWGIFKIN